MYADLDNYKKQVLISVVVAPLRKWHGSQNVQLRDTTSSLEWVKAQCKEDVLRHVLDTVAILGSQSTCLLIGIETNFADDTFEDGVVGARCVREDSLASHLGSMVIALMCSRLRWGMDFVQASTRRACLLADSDEQQVAFIDDWRRAREIVDEAEACGVVQVAQIAKRSHVKTMPGQQLTAVLEQAGWLATQTVVDFARARSLRLMGTQLLEDGFNVQKKGARRAPT